MHHTVIMNRSWLGWPSSIFHLTFGKGHWPIGTY